MGDAVFPGQYVQTMLGDLGVVGPERVDTLERIRVIDDQRRALDRDEKGDSIRGKRKKKSDDA